MKRVCIPMLILSLLSACISQIEPLPSSSATESPPLALAPLVCMAAPTPVPRQIIPASRQPLIGGGTTRIREFTLSIWLYCDSAFEAEITESSYTIASLGVYAAWQYEGPVIEGDVSDFWGLAPSPPARGVYPGLTPGSLNSYSRPLSIPGRPPLLPSTAPITVEYILTVRVPSTTASARLTLSLIATPDGYLPINIVVSPTD